MNTVKHIVSFILALILAFGALSISVAEAPIDDFEIVTSEGKVWRLSEQLASHRAVVLNFWFVDCSWCRLEFPFLQEAYEKYASDIALLAVSPFDEDDDINAFKREMNLTFDMAYDVDIYTAFDIISYPTTVVIDRFGVKCFSAEYTMPNAGAFERLFEAFTADDYTESLVNFKIPAAKSSVANPDSDALSAVMNAEKPETAEPAAKEVPAGAESAADETPVNDEVVTKEVPELVWSCINDEAVWPFVPAEMDGRTVLSASNSGEALTICSVETTVSAAAGDALSFEFACDAEHMGFFIIAVNGEISRVFSGAHNWTGYAVQFPADGEYNVRLTYEKKSNITYRTDDAVYLDNAAYLTGDAAKAAIAANPAQVKILSGSDIQVEAVTSPAETLTVNDPDALVPYYMGLGDCEYILIPGADTVTLRVLLGEELDPETVLVYCVSDCDYHTLSEADERGYLLTVPTDSIETTGYSYGGVQVIANALNENDLGKFTVIFVSEENANYFCEIDMGGLITWSHADGSLPDVSDLPEVETVEEGAYANYALVFVDQNGDSVPGVIASVCSDAFCIPMTADEQGRIEFTDVPYEYEIHILKVPAGYSFDTTQDFKSPLNGGVMEFTFVKN